MSILIKGMEMPKNCDKCWALDDYGDYPRCRITEEQRGYNFRIRENRMDDCPLVPVPEHGDLIDYDFCMGNYELLHDDDGNHVYAVRMRDINNAPTIIPADKEGEG